MATYIYKGSACVVIEQAPTPQIAPAPPTKNLIGRCGSAAMSASDRYPWVVQFSVRAFAYVCNATGLFARQNHFRTSHRGFYPATVYGYISSRVGNP